MSQAKWIIVNGSKYPNEDVDISTIYNTEQTEEDVQNTTKDMIYFKDYVVTKSDDGNISFKRRKIK
jgi:hypothetical protein